MQRERKAILAFTLIELLIVVAIIAILAAIAVPNFLEAQTRAKVSRAKADMRTLAMALESYAVDNGSYPLNNGGEFAIPPIEITTPIAYISQSRMVDPFSAKQTHPFWGELARFYTYDRIVSKKDILDGNVRYPLPVESIDAPGFNLGAYKKYGPWRLVSVGPDRRYITPGFLPVPFHGLDIPYDPTNGTVSYGNILRTHRSPTGRIVYD